MADPNFCLKVLFTNVEPTADPNIYTASFTASGVSQILVGMWAVNTSYGHALRINSITSVSDTEISVVLEDVNSYNSENDPSGNGGGPTNDTNGYIFNLTSSGLNALSLISSSICFGNKCCFAISIFSSTV